MKNAKPIRRIIIGAISLLVIFLYGTLGFHWIEGYDVLDSIYMTTITVSTVGYGTLQELSDAGRLFTVSLIVLSSGIFLYVITSLTTFILEGEMQQILNRYRQSKIVSKLQNHFIICGLGRNGREAAREFIRQDQAFVIIEQNEEVLEEFLSHHKCHVVRGDATHDDVLERANIRRASGLISALATDAENVYISLTAREMNPKIKIIARASNPSSISKLKRAGANDVIVPNKIGGQKMANLLTRPALVEFVDLISGEGNPDLHLMDIPCEGQTKLVGKTLRELNIRSRTGVLVLGFKHGDQAVALNPTADDEIQSEDRLFILGTDIELEAFQKAFIS
ncbi:potassium channel protein [Pontibacter sp. G13]|uniref:potassium channel family protein n=1 Tax=Pontibacter sp. G13 TaxID=3074898 RepID=UPI00288B2B16|nr:potassium channel protein [Pontibacter sp. G13]WNJ16586.1 potassium channel protein [Pontibacter sp. G13]